MGTAVEIVGRKKPRFLDRHDDNVRLLEVVEGYALATEFPIEARCTIPEIEGAASIPPEIATRPTDIEEDGISDYVTLEQDFSEIHPLLRGKIRESFLTDGKGRITLINEQAMLAKHPLDYDYKIILRDQNEYRRLLSKRVKHRDRFLKGFGPLCIDGIYIAGQPGRNRHIRLPKSPDGLHLSGRTRCTFVVDVRGTIKPKLKADRTPKSAYDPNMQLVERCVRAAQARIWDSVLNRIDDEIDANMFSKFACAYDVPITYLDPRIIWKKLYIPIKSGLFKRVWINIPDVSRVGAGPSWFGRGYSLLEESRQILPSGDLMIYGYKDSNKCSYFKRTRHSMIAVFKGNRKIYQWPKGRNRILNMFLDAIKSVSEVSVKDGRPFLVPRQPSGEVSSLSEHNILRLSWQNVEHCTMPFQPEASGTFCLGWPFNTLNRNHYLVRSLNESVFENNDPIVRFARALADNIIYGIQGHVRELAAIGRHYSGVPWETIAECYHPPYVVWTLEEGNVEITYNILMMWSKKFAQYFGMQSQSLDSLITKEPFPFDKSL